MEKHSLSTLDAAPLVPWTGKGVVCKVTPGLIGDRLPEIYLPVLLLYLVVVLCYLVSSFTVPEVAAAHPGALEFLFECD